jgi:hypothetical protein
VLKKDTLFYKEARKAGLPQEYFDWLCGDSIVDLSADEFLLKRGMASFRDVTETQSASKPSEEPVTEDSVAGNSVISETVVDDSMISSPVLDDATVFNALLYDD